MPIQYMLICELMSKDLHRHLHTLKIMGYALIAILNYWYYHEHTYYVGTVH